MVLFYYSMDEFQTINKWSIILSIIVLKYCKIEVTLIQCNMMTLMEYNSYITLSSIAFVHNGLRNRVVGVIFAYSWCEGGRSVDLELCFAKDSMNALGND